ncbi:MAG: hypothetical protein H6720_03840 [Sandaracinus sp.]|nr:hypothetical protein [Sandaracinus sp.]MCB9621764.1 hypothetical protein [Sandaracinus sp.]
MRHDLVCALVLLAACDCGKAETSPCGDACPTARCVEGTCLGDDDASVADAAVDALPGDATVETRLDGGDDYCLGSGPPILVGDGDAVECVGRTAGFRFALCTCDDLVTSHTLTTDSFDSGRGPYMAPGGVGGSVGTNRVSSSSATWDVGGSYWASGSGAVTAGSPLAVGSELHVAARLAGSRVDVERDAWVGGGVGLEALRVVGTLTVPEGRDLVAASSEIGATVRAPVDVAAPCACDPADQVDIAAYVAHHTTDNDNASIGLDPGALANVSSETTLDLPCGRFYLASVSATAPITLRVAGRVALFVDGPLTANDDFTVELAEGAEVDVFVTGTVTAAGAFSLGSAEAPARARLYVATNGTLNMSASTVFAGNLYAPNAELVTAGDLEVFGSVFVRRLAASGAVAIHYDTRILEAGDSCDPPDVCESCGDCPASEACVDGSCGACRTSDDCCAPLLCIDGACVPELI